MLAPAHYWLVPEAEALADRLAELRRQRKQRRQAKKPAPKPWVPVAHANSASASGEAAGAHEAVLGGEQRHEATAQQMPGEACTLRCGCRKGSGRSAA